MSSLQQALKNEASRLETKKLCDNKSKKRQDGCGAFETTFAKGLDISELVAVSNTPVPTDTYLYKRESAADNLLKIKKEERRKRQIQEAEETRMEEALQRRLDSLKQHTHNMSKERKQSLFDVGDALFRMHDTDEMATSILSQKANSRKVGNGSRANRRQNSAPKRKNHKSKKTPIAKKSRHIKF